MRKLSGFVPTDILGKIDEGFRDVEERLSTDASKSNPTVEEIVSGTSELWEKYRRIASILPQREVDMAEMSFLLDKDQTSIGKMLNVSQGDVSYRIKRFKKRVAYLLSLPEVDPERMRVDLCDVLGEELANIMILLLFYTSQSKVAEVLGLTQVKVRQRYLTCLRILQRNSLQKPYLLVYFDYLIKLGGNYNSLRLLNVQSRWKHKFDVSQTDITI